MKFCLFKKTVYGSFRQRITMGKYKKMPDLGIFTHILTYSGIIRHIQAQSALFENYSGMFRTLGNPGIFRNLVYSEP